MSFYPATELPRLLSNAHKVDTVGKAHSTLQHDRSNKLLKFKVNPETVKV